MPELQPAASTGSTGEEEVCILKGRMEGDGKCGMEEEEGSVSEGEMEVEGGGV